MKIYQSEKDAGLSEQIATAEYSKASVTMALGNEKIRMATAKKLLKDEDREYRMGRVPADVMVVNAILVTNNWNKNDDVFTSADMWEAKNTPLYKPANMNHLGRESVSANETIGVISDCYPVDDEYESIWGGDVKSLPECFHLLISVYLWEQYFPAKIATIKKNIADGKQFVSMECLFPDFGYALQKDGEDEVSLMERNDLTSWLTAYLRAYGGKGVLEINGQKWRIGRWLKDLIFSGVGFVEVPANEGSIVFEDYMSHANLKFKNMPESSVCSLKKGKISLYGNF